MAGVECLVIDTSSTMISLENELRWNDLYYRMNH